MKEEYKRVLELLPTANSEELKVMATVLYHIIDALEETIKSNDRTIETLKHTINSDERIETLKEIIKSKDERIETLKETIDLLESQRKQREFEKVFKGKYIGEA